MAKPKNLHIYNKDQEVLVTLRAEYIMLGFDTELESGHLTVLTRKRKKVKKKEKEKTERNKRAESAARRN